MPNQPRSLCALRFLLLALALQPIATATAQLPVRTWAKTYGSADAETFHELVQGPGNGFRAVGYSYNHFPKSTLLVTQLDCDGSITWQKAYMPTLGVSPSGGASIQRATSGAFTGGSIVGGTIDGGVATGYDYWVLGLDAAGSPVWQKQLGGPGTEFFYRVRSLDDGSVLAIGESTSFSAPDFDPWIVRLDQATGAVLWQRTFVGGPLAGFDAAQLASGDIVVVGMTTPTPFQFDGWAARLTLAGATVWEKSFDVAPGDRFEAVVPSSDGGCLVAGKRNSGAPTGTWIVRLDASGGILWERQFIEPGSSDSGGHSSLSRAPGDTYLVASNESKVFDERPLVMRIDDLGNIVWQSRLDGPKADAVHSVTWIQPPSGTWTGAGVMAAGRLTDVGLGSWDAVAFRLDALGRIPGCPLVTVPNEVVTTPVSVVTALATAVTTAVVPVDTFEVPFDPGLVEVTHCSVGLCP